MNEKSLPNGPDALYQHYLSEGRLMIQKCDACGRHGFAPRVLCKYCGSGRLNWVAPSGRGHIYSATVMRRKPEAGGDYLYALVELEEGVRLISTVVGTAPHEVAIGSPVISQIERSDNGPRIVFKMAGGAQ